MSLNELQKLTVLGTGVLGSQIIFQAAYCGKNVVAYGIDEENLAELPARWEYFKPRYLRDVAGATPEALEAAVSRIHTTSDLAEAVSDADIIIEAVPEAIEIKQQTWQQVSEFAPEKTIFCTNSSTLLPSKIAPFTDRPEKFLALHFANEIWRFNVGEVMGHAQTDPEVYEQVVEFAEQIGMVPIRVKKEQAGYVLNSLLVPFLEAGAKLLVRGVAEPKDIDTTWRIASGAPAGPFQVYDLIGMQTSYMLSIGSNDPEMHEFAELLKRQYIDRGRLGKGAGGGFYDYRR